MHLIFFEGTGFISRMIQFQTRSKYSHVGVILDHHIYEAWHVGGVQRDRAIDLSDAEFYEINISDEGSGQMHKFLESKLGAKYDFLMVARFLSRRPAKDNDKYFCSELVMDAFKAAGVDLLHAESHNVSPRDLSMSPLLNRVSQ